jgi:hypothetical protein
MYPRARSINSSIHRVGRLARPVPFKCRQIPSTGFSSGQATGSQRSSIPNSLANLRLLLAVWGEPRSRNNTIFHPRHWDRRCLRCSWKLSWFHRSAWSRQMDPVLTLRAPYSALLFRLPVTGTSAGTPLSVHWARRGGVSVTMVASVNSTTVRFLSLRPRFSPLLLAARKGPFGPAHTWAVSTDSPSLSDTGGPCCRLPQYPLWLAGGSAAGRRSNPQPGSHIGWAGCLSPAQPYPAWPVACSWDGPNESGPASSGPRAGHPPASTVGPRSRQLHGSLPIVGRWLWGVLLGPATVNPGPGGPSGHPDRDWPGAAVPVAGGRSNLCEPSHPPLNQLRSG